MCVESSFRRAAHSNYTLIFILWLCHINVSYVAITFASRMYTQTTAYRGNIHAAAVNASEISKYNKDTKCHHQGKSRTTVAPDKIDQAASSTNNKQTIHINQESDTSAMLTSCAQSSPTDAALRIHSNLMHWAKIE